MTRIEDLISKAAEYMPPAASLELIRKAYVYSATLHRHHFNANGVPAVQHALEVSSLLADLHLDPRSLVAGLLHDVLQEELAGAEALRETVGEDVTRLVEEVSLLSRAAYRGTEAARADNMRQMILASTRDLRVILILLADRLQHLREADPLPAEERRGLARETLAIYAPIAHRLGIHFFKAEMEDLAFRILEPEAFGELQQRVEKRVAERSARIDAINTELRELLAASGLEAEVLGRTKHLYSIHTKMKRTQVDLDQIYDVLATRIIVDSTEDCYRALGLVHAAYTPIPGRFKDYIALPKANGYQSLHTLVFGASGDMFEIQIRTDRMHHLAEMGIAAHFAYKDGGTADDKELVSVAWFRQLLDNLEEGRDPQESMDLFQRDLEPDQIFCFTPKGEVIKLPLRATPLDFAYAIHSEVGSKCMGAKMDGRMVSIRTPLRNGAVVEIITHPRQEPKEDWLKHAVSSKAQSRIRSYLRRQEKNEAIRVGKEMVAREARRAGMKLEELFKSEPFQVWMNRHNLNTPDELYAAEGFGRVSILEALERLFPAPSAEPEPATEPETPPPPPTPPSGRHKTQVSIDGLDNMMMRFAKCCQPVFGDPIVGIITRGRGVSVHHRECRNLVRQAYGEERVVDVEWVEDNQQNRPVTLEISTDRSMKDLLSVIGLLEDDEGARITSGRIASRQGIYTQQLTLLVRSSKQLQRILQRLNAMDGIRAERVLESA